MDTVIVYVDDAEYARQIIEPLAQSPDSRATHWVLVACAPRMTHRISKWVSHSARESWRAKWADKLFAQVTPWLGARNAQISTVLAKTPLPELLEQLHAKHGAQAQLVDARRPKQENQAAATLPTVVEQPALSIQPVTAPAVTVTIKKKPSRTWALPGTLASLFCMVFVAAE